MGTFLIHIIINTHKLWVMEVLYITYDCVNDLFDNVLNL